ncbi:hypothetical protein AVEN_176634-1 [Araneus ventricosus]|uniref:Secreted protein n=1 Tax=Araneus ventricosus TaxID=182803 RepID=A0A4Y2HY83_ARAVE|nr:hypothetical protein AVEN_176634-1 [Araneus ventricosus]
MNKSSPLTSFCLLSKIVWSLAHWRPVRGLASSLTGPQPTGLFLLGAHKVFSVRDARGSRSENRCCRRRNYTAPGIFERVRQSFLRRCKLCSGTRGRHSKHLLRVFL